MRSTRLIHAAFAVMALAGPATAQTVNGFQYIFGFDDPTEPFGLGPSTGIETDFSCDSCKIATPGVDYDARFPAYSGTRLLAVNSDFQIATADPDNISWPAFGAFVTGSAVVTARFYAYDPDTGLQDLVATLQTSGANYVGSGASPDQYLGYTNPEPAAVLTLADYSSTEPFTLDDVTLGLVDGPIGIPEPSTWAMLLMGFFGLGAALRRRWRPAADQGSCI